MRRYDSQMTPVQLKVLELAHQGRGRVAICKELGITVNTLKIRIDRIRERLEMPKGTPLAALAVEARRRKLIR